MTDQLANLTHEGDVSIITLNDGKALPSFRVIIDTSPSWVKFANWSVIVFPFNLYLIL